MSHKGNRENGKSAKGNRANGKSTKGSRANGKSTKGNTANGKSTKGNRANGKSTKGNTANGKSAKGNRANGKSAKGNTANRESTKGNRANGKKCKGQLSKCRNDRYLIVPCFRTTHIHTGDPSQDQSQGDIQLQILKPLSSLLTYRDCMVSVISCNPPCKDGKARSIKETYVRTIMGN